MHKTTGVIEDEVELTRYMKACMPCLFWSIGTVCRIGLLQTMVSLNYWTKYSLLLYSIEGGKLIDFAYIRKIESLSVSYNWWPETAVSLYTGSYKGLAFLVVKRKVLLSFMNKHLNRSMRGWCSVIEFMCANVLECKKALQDSFYSFVVVVKF